MACSPRALASEENIILMGNRTPPPRLNTGQTQVIIDNPQLGVGRNDKYRIRFNAHVLLDLTHRHRRLPLQQFREHGFMCRVKMLHDNVSHAAAGRDGGQEVFKRHKAAR